MLEGYDDHIADFIAESDENSIQEAKKKASHGVEQPEAGPTTAITAEQVEELVRDRLIEQIATAHTNGMLLDLMPRTDGDAIRLAGPIINDRVVVADGVCYEYNGKVFARDEGGTLLNDIARGIRAAINDCIDAVKSKYWSNVDNGDNKITSKVFNGREAKMKDFDESKRTGSIKRGLESEFMKPKTIFLNNRYIAFKNLVIDTVESKKQKKTVTLAHDPSLYIPNRCYIDHNFIDGAQPGPALNQFLTYSFQSYEDGVNCFRGLSIGLFDSGKKRKIIMDLHGKPDSGKSMISRLMDHITGLTKTASKDHFALSSNSNFALTSLRGFKLIFIPEMSRKIDDELSKQWSGGDTIDTDVKNGERIQYLPEGIIIFQSNSDDGTGLDVAEEGMKLRYVPVWFPHQFTSEGITAEGFNQNYVKDMAIEDRLYEEADVIVSWMFGLWFEWNKLGIDTLPLTKNQEEIRDRKAGDLKTVDRVIQWYVDNEAIVQADKVAKNTDWLAFDDFSKMYQQFCSSRRIEALTDRKLAASMRKDGLAKKFDKLRIPGYVAGEHWAVVLASLAEEEGL